jgi:hypothetical protein
MNTPEFDRLNKHIPRFGGFLKGDPDAVQFVVLVFRALHVWDDLIDKDKAVADDEIHSVFWDLLVSLPASRFYQANLALLNSTLVNAIVNWHIANKLEREGDDKDKSIAFILRGAYIDILSASALIVGGLDWAREVGPAIRRWAHEETFAQYLDNFAKECEVRDAGQKQV